MTDPQLPGRRGSEVLDAIWDKVSDKPDRTVVANSLFRAKALEQLDVPAEVDNQLQLVKRRSWLLLVGLALLVCAVLLWATMTPSVTSVPAGGRVVAAPGVAAVLATGSGVLAGPVLVQGADVHAGQTLATVRGANADFPIVASANGTMWQVLAIPGDHIVQGDRIATLLPPHSDATALLVVPEAQAAGLSVGMPVDVSAGASSGAIAEISAPLSAVEVARRIAVTVPGGGDQVILTVVLSKPLPAGAPAWGEVILSRSTVVGRLLGHR